MADIQLILMGHRLRWSSLTNSGRSFLPYWPKFAENCSEQLALMQNIKCICTVYDMFNRDHWGSRTTGLMDLLRQKIGSKYQCAVENWVPSIQPPVWESSLLFFWPTILRSRFVISTEQMSQHRQLAPERHVLNITQEKVTNVWARSWSLTACIL